MLKKIDVEQLRTGMFVVKLCGSWLEHPFWKTKFLVDDEEDLERLRASAVKEVLIDITKGLDVDDPGPEPSAEIRKPAPPAPPPRTPASVELDRAAKLCEEAKPAVENMFREARMGQSIDAGGMKDLVNEISSSVMRHPTAFVSLARLKTKDDYTYMHSVAVCGLMAALARRLGLDDDSIREAGLAGLLHDLGKAAIPLDVLNKPGKLTDAEFTVVKDHPSAGHGMLLEAGGVGDVALDVVLHHHEKVDGSGYPHRLAGDQISLFAKMGAVCDVYDAITSDRPYKAGWNPSEALKKMASWAPGHFDMGIFKSFVQTVGIYPLGTLVRLESGLLAVVVETRESDLIKPIVKAFYCTRRKEPLLPRVNDLARPNVTDAIAAWESRDKWRFPELDELWVGHGSAASG